MDKHIIQFSLSTIDLCPSFLFAREIQEICSPLFINTPINYFSFIRIYPDGSFIDLNSDPLWTKHFLSKGYFSAGVEEAAFMFFHDNAISWNSTSFFDCHKKLAELYKDGCDFNYTNGICITQSNSDYFENYHFFTANRDGYADQFFMTNYNTLLNFIFYFKEKVLQTKAIRSIYDNKYIFIEDSPPKKSEIITMPDLEKTLFLPQPCRFYLSDDSFLTKQEINILSYAIRSFSCKEIAKLLNISYRTVETHMNNIKKKTNSKNIRELHQCVLKNKLLFNAL